MNNPQVFTITDVRFAKYFGFTDEEVKRLLNDYGLSHVYDGMKEWYDGYRFGNVDVYCPWDVVCYCSKLRADGAAWPGDFYRSNYDDV